VAPAAAAAPAAAVADETLKDRALALARRSRTRVQAGSVQQAITEGLPTVLKLVRQAAGADADPGSVQVAALDMITHLAQGAGPQSAMRSVLDLAPSLLPMIIDADEGKTKVNAGGVASGGASGVTRASIVVKVYKSFKESLADGFQVEDVMRLVPVIMEMIEGSTLTGAEKANLVVEVVEVLGAEAGLTDKPVWRTVMAAARPTIDVIVRASKGDFQLSDVRNIVVDVLDDFSDEAAAAAVTSFAWCGVR
jgi:hypothetical protein